jgi:predicted ester cyclase
VHSDFVFHYPNGGELRGIENLKKSVINFQTAFPDGYHLIEDQIAEGDKVATRYTWTGTHAGEYMGVSPTDKQLKFTMIEICRIKNGKIVEAWMEFDPSVFNIKI